MASSRRILALLAGGLLLGGAYDAGDIQPRMQAPGWAERHQEKLQEIHQGPVDLIFLGDSITQELESSNPDWGDIDAVWQKYYGCRHAVNLGFNGDTTGSALWRIENGEIDGIHPRLAVVMIGSTNIRPRLPDPASATTAGVLQVVAELRRRLSGTHILLLGLPPTGLGPVTEGRRHDVNAALAAHDWSGMDVTFQPTEDALEQDGTLDPSLYRPGTNGPVHPNAAGWERVAALIEPVVGRLMGKSCVQ